MSNPIAIPDDLKELDRWGVWRSEMVGGRPAKIPYSVSQARHYRADSTDADDWTEYERADEALRRTPDCYSGLAFCFFLEDGLCGIDLDDCLSDDARVKPWAQGIVERFGDTYMEVSPSGSGIKIWARGSIPSNIGGRKVGDGQIEVYSQKRYFTVTGQVFSHAPMQLEDHSADLELLYERLSVCHTYRHSEPTVGPTRVSIASDGDGVIPFGRQHNTLVSLAGTLRRRRVCDEAIEVCLQVVNAVQCQRPGPPENISRIVRSTRTWGTR